METISKRYIPDEELIDPLSKLFRGLLNKMKMNPYKWTKFLNDHLDWVVTSKDPERARTERLVKTGNIRDAFFHKPRLSAAKLFEGLSITQMTEYTITLEVKNAQGETFVISESGAIKHAKNSTTDDIPTDLGDD